MAVAGGLGVLWLVGALVADGETARVDETLGWLARVVVVALCVAGLVLLARAPRPYRFGPVARLHPAFAVALALLIANAASPYLGLKTESSFAMFSNLQTEGETWNHLLLPEAVRVFTPQDNLVRVVASSDPALLRRTSAGTRMVEFELQRYVRLHPGVEATYTVAGETRVATGDGPFLAPLIDRVAKFRDVRTADRRGC